MSDTTVELKPMMKLTVADLLEERQDIVTTSKMFHGRMIAKDAYDGKILFDTRKNKRDFVQKFFNDNVCAMWAEMREIWKPSGYSASYEAVLCLYVHHNGADEGGQINHDGRCFHLQMP